MNLRPLFKGIWSWTKRNSTKLLAAGAITAEAFGFYFMHREAPVVRDRLEELGPDAKWIDKLKAAGPVYLPAAGMFILSAGCIVGGCAVGEKKAAIMASLYSMSEATLRKYEQEIVDKVGEKKAKEIHDSVAQDLLDERPLTPTEVILTGKGNVLFFDPWSGRYFRSSLDAVKNDIADYNTFVSSQCWATFNDFYDCLGIGEAQCAEYFGYNLDHKLVVAFDEGSTTNTKELCWVLRYAEKPVMWNGKQARNFRECENCYIND